ncbi:MAG: ATP-dependent Clp protease ATP-binding subunit [Candidatus Paceibacterota bacterium]
MFDLRKSDIFRAIVWERRINLRVFRIVGKLLFLFSILLVIMFILTIFVAPCFSKEDILSKGVAFSGMILITLTLSLALWQKEMFLRMKLNNPKPKAKIEEAISNPELYNLADFLSFDAAKACWKARNNSTALLYYLLRDNSRLNFIFYRTLLDLDGIKKVLKNSLKEIREVSSPDFLEIILESLKNAKKEGHQQVDVGDLLTALAGQEPFLKKVLLEHNLKTIDIENLTWWLEDVEKRYEERKKFWERRNIVKTGSMAKEWTAGYTLTLDRFSTDISALIKKKGYPETVGHQKEIAAMERILARRESNNVLVVGEPGSGRKSMVEELAKRSALGETLPEINFKKFVRLELSNMLAQTKSSGEAENILDTIFREVVSAGNIILVIDEFHNFVGKSAQPGMVDISGVLSPYLPLPRFQTIALTSFEGLHKNIEQNPSILSLFDKVEVSEISERETLMILEDLVFILERKYKKFISYPAIREIINYSGKYMPAVPFPEKAMGLMDEVMVYLAQTKDRVLLPKHVAKIISEKTQIPVGEMETKEKEILLNLEDLIHQKIINQEEAVKEISSALRRSRADITVRKGPMGCFLFLGPTGVGKTETSKALAEIYFGSENRMIRIDMSEFQNVGDIPRLIGSPGEEGLLTTKVRERPFSLILLDEIEKAHPNILNLFLQVLDEGHLTDGMGRKVDFKNSIIIATSNAGYQIILDCLKQNTEWSQVKGKILDFVFSQGLFRPEFINRFDSVVVFRSLTKENLMNIAELLLQGLKKNLKRKEVEFIITTALKEKIVDLGYDPVFGARQMRRVIQDKIENALASALLSGQLKKGNKVEIDPQDFGLEIN